MPACHAGGRRFEPVRIANLIEYRGNMAQLVEQLTVNQWVTGSSPVIPANMLVWLNGRAADL